MSTHTTERSPEMWLEDYLHSVYCLTHTLRPKTIYQYQIVVNNVDEWSGDPVRVCDLSDDLVNEFLQHLETKGLAPATIRNRRTHLLSLWHAAHRDGLCPNKAHSIRVARVPYNPPTAWRWEDVKLLLDTAEQRSGTYPSERWQLPTEIRWIRQRGCLKVSCATYWGLFIRLSWDTGLRMCDVFELAMSSFNNDGHGEIVQRKTRKWHLFRVHPETLQFVRASYPPVREFIMPTWHASWELWRQHFGILVASAGLRGTAKKIRKSSATEVEKFFPGCGATHLGHVSEMNLAQAHYLDPRLLIANKPMPRPLRTLDVEEGGVA